MTGKLLPAFLVLLICLTVNLQAQDTADSLKKSKPPVKHQMNFIKVSITNLAFKNYTIQYERVLTRAISVSATYRYMPSSSIPFANSIKKLLDDGDSSGRKVIETFRIGNFAITPEVRFYLGKGYGKGFYIALFYRYARFDASHILIDYDDNYSLDLSGKLTSNTGGILFGAQWSFGKHICLDWQIFGPHYGSGKGDFSGLSNQPLTQQQQDELKSNLDEIDLPLTTKTVNVNANGASLKLSGPWGGIRAGISLGFKF